jgi:hypothetical protein
MFNTIVGAWASGATSRYGSGSDQKMRLRLRNTDYLSIFCKEVKGKILFINSSLFREPAVSAQFVRLEGWAEIFAQKMHRKIESLLCNAAGCLICIEIEK